MYLLSINHIGWRSSKEGIVDLNFQKVTFLILINRGLPGKNSAVFLFMSYQLYVSLNSYIKDMYLFSGFLFFFFPLERCYYQSSEADLSLLYYILNNCSTAPVFIETIIKNLLLCCVLWIYTDVVKSKTSQRIHSKGMLKLLCKTRSPPLISILMLLSLFKSSDLSFCKKNVSLQNSYSSCSLLIIFFSLFYFIFLKAIAPLLENNHPPPDLCEFFCKVSEQLSKI